MSTRWKYSLDVNSWNTRFLKVQLTRNFDQERENCSQILVCMMCHEEIIVFTVDKCKFKGFTVKLWKKTTFKPLLPQPWKIAILRKCGWKNSHLAALVISVFYFCIFQFFFIFLNFYLRFPVCVLHINFLI